MEAPLLDGVAAGSDESLVDPVVVDEAAEEDGAPEPPLSDAVDRALCKRGDE